MNARKFDPTDYAEEWRHLTSLGVRGADIMARSRPSTTWYVQEVMPLITYARCTGCGNPFKVHEAKSLVKCHGMCSIQPTWGRNGRGRR
jgi:hypothetical protein